MLNGRHGADGLVIERKTLCLSSPTPGLATHSGHGDFEESIVKYFQIPENNAAERLVALKADLRKADTEEFWRRLMEGMTEICHAQYGFVAKRILVDDHDSAVEMPPIGEPGSCLMGVAFYYNDGQLQKGMHRDYKYLAWGAPCAHMRHDKVFLIPERLSAFITNNPNAFPFPTEAYLGVPLFFNGKCFAHFGLMWTQDGLDQKDVSWGYLEMVLHSLEDLILDRLLTGRGFAKKAPAEKTVENTIIPQAAITAQQSLKPYARSLSHELRTPMQGVVGMLDVMLATVQEAIEGQSDPKHRNEFQALKENIEVAQDSARRAVEAADNVVHAYDLNMQVPETPQVENETRLSATFIDNKPNILIEGSNIPVNPHKRRRSTPFSWHNGQPTKMRDTKSSPRRDMSPRTALQSVRPTPSALGRSPERVVTSSPISHDDQLAATSMRRESPRFAIDADPYLTPSLKSTEIRKLLPSVIHESLHVGGRPDSAISEPTEHGERIEVRSRSSNGGASRITIDWSVHHEVPEVLLVDEKDLDKLISNVLLNAIKFTEDGNINIAVRPSKHGRYIIINIVDSGMGIPEEFVPELFKAFSQEDTSLTRNKEGLGLGLMVAKGIARRIGGDLNLVRTETSGPARGSDFEIKVPIDASDPSTLPGTPLDRTPTPNRGFTETSRASASYHSHVKTVLKATSPLQNLSFSRQNSGPPQSHPPESAPRRLSSTPRNPHALSAHHTDRAFKFDKTLSQRLPLTFLVAEDNKINRKLLVSMLRKFGYTDIYEAFDGREAVRIMTEIRSVHSRPASGAKTSLASSYPPVDVVLMDLWMPEMDGYEATEKILAMYPSHDDDDDQQQRDQSPEMGGLLPPPTILAVSADVTETAIERATRTGMEGFMTKPYKLMDLQRLIEMFCAPR